MIKKTDEKALSPVISTVIIVAVAIAVALAVAYWVTGMIPNLIQHREIRIISCNILDSTNVVIYVMNTGNTKEKVDYILVNGRLSNPGDPLNIPLESGEHKGILTDVSHYPVKTFRSGIRYDFVIHTSTGLSYPISARAP